MQQKEREEPVNQAKFPKPIQSVKETCDQYVSEDTGCTGAFTVTITDADPFSEDLFGVN